LFLLITKANAADPGTMMEPIRNKYAQEYPKLLATRFATYANPSANIMRTKKPVRIVAKIKRNFIGLVP